MDLRPPEVRRLLARMHLLNPPGVAVGIGEEDEPAPRERLDLAGINPAFEELFPGGVGIVYDQLQPLDRAGLHPVNAARQRDRARRTRWRQLHEAHLVADLMVVFGVEPGALGVERLGPVNVGDRDLNQLELPIHGAFLSFVWLSDRPSGYSRECQAIGASQSRPPSRARALRSRPGAGAPDLVCACVLR